MSAADVIAWLRARADRLEREGLEQDAERGYGHHQHHKVIAADNLRRAADAIEQGEDP